MLNKERVCNVPSLESEECETFDNVNAGYRACVKLGKSYSWLLMAFSVNCIPWVLKLND